MKRTLDDLARLCRLEDFYTFFGLRYEPAVIDAHRTAILKRFGIEVAAVEERRPIPSEPERLAIYADVLRRSHDEAARGIRPVARPFRVIDGGRARPLVEMGRGPGPS